MVCYCFVNGPLRINPSEKFWKITPDRSTNSYLFTALSKFSGSRVVSVLDLGTVGPGLKSQLRRCLGQTLHTHCASVHQAATLVAALLRVAMVTAGLAESNGSLPLGLWLTSPADWLPRTGISSGTLCSLIEYGLPLPFSGHIWVKHIAI